MSSFAARLTAPFFNTAYATPKTDGKGTAVERVFRIPELQEAIFLRCAPPDIAALRRVNHSFYDMVQTPKVWRHEYSPATISYEMRRVFSASRHDSTSGQWTGETSKAKEAVLGRFENQLWTLHTGAVPARPRTAASDAFFDEVTRLASCGSTLRTTSTPAGPEQVTEPYREASYRFLLDRIYRLNHRLPISTYDPGALLLVAAAAILLPGFILMYAEEKGETRNIEQMRKSGYIRQTPPGLAKTALFGAYIVVFVPALITLLTLLDEAEIKRNLFLGPWQRYKLNQLARELSENPDCPTLR